MILIDPTTAKPEHEEQICNLQKAIRDRFDYGHEAMDIADALVKNDEDFKDIFDDFGVSMLPKRPNGYWEALGKGNIETSKWLKSYENLNDLIDCFAGFAKQVKKNKLEILTVGIVQNDLKILKKLEKNTK